MRIKEKQLLAKYNVGVIKFFEGESREETFFQKSFLSGGGAGAKPPQRRKPALKGLGKTRVFPNFPFQMLAFETGNRWRGSGGTGRFPPRFGLSTVTNEKSTKRVCTFGPNQQIENLKTL